MNTTLASHHKSTTVRSYASPRPSAFLPVKALTRRFPRLALPLLERLFFSPTKRRPATDATSAMGRFDVMVAGTRVPVMVWGEGPLALCVHGWAGSGQQFHALRDHLTAHGYSVALFDAPAHGGTAGSRTHAGEFVEAIFKVAEALGPVHLLVGHSLGATASYVAVQRGLPVSGLGLLAPMPSLEFALDSFASTTSIDTVTKRALAARVAQRAALEPRELDLSQGPPGDRRTLLVHDQDDRAIPAEATRRLAAQWPGSTLLTTTGLGHNGVLTSPKVLLAVSDFASSLSVAPRNLLDRQLVSLSLLPF